jgi:hypothetical protein
MEIKVRMVHPVTPVIEDVMVRSVYKENQVLLDLKERQDVLVNKAIPVYVVRKEIKVNPVRKANQVNQAFKVHQVHLVNQGPQGLTVQWETAVYPVISVSPVK